MLSADKPLTRSTCSKRHCIGRAAMEAKYGVPFTETVKRLNYTWGRLRGDDSGRGDAVETKPDGAKKYGIPLSREKPCGFGNPLKARRP
jgi:hypothetical protein